MRVSINKFSVNRLSTNRSSTNRMPAIQSGATLVVVLIVLLAMTLTATSMMNTAILQEQMAANSRQKTVSRYAAESALNQAERMIKAKNFAVKSNMEPLFNRDSKGYYSAISLLSPSGVIRTASPVDFDITDMPAWDDNTNSVSVDGVIDDAITARAPQYIIEYIGQRQPDPLAEQPPDPAEAVMQPEPPYFFRVIAIGWGKDPQIYTILQSIYRLKPKQENSDAAAVEDGRISWSIIH